MQTMTRNNLKRVHNLFFTCKKLTPKEIDTAISDIIDIIKKEVYEIINPLWSYRNKDACDFYHTVSKEVEEWESKGGPHCADDYFLLSMEDSAIDLANYFEYKLLLYNTDDSRFNLTKNTSFSILGDKVLPNREESKEYLLRFKFTKFNENQTKGWDLIIPEIKKD